MKEMKPARLDPEAKRGTVTMTMTDEEVNGKVRRGGRAE